MKIWSGCGVIGSGTSNVPVAFDATHSVGTWKFCRGVAQLVEHTAGGRVVAGSNPVTPTEFPV